MSPYAEQRCHVGDVEERDERRAASAPDRGTRRLWPLASDQDEQPGAADQEADRPERSTGSSSRSASFIAGQLLPHRTVRRAEEEETRTG